VPTVTFFTPPGGGSSVAVVIAARGSPTSNPTSPFNPRGPTGASSSTVRVCSPGFSSTAVNPSGVDPSTGSRPSASRAARGNPRPHPRATTARGAVVWTEYTSVTDVTCVSPASCTFARIAHPDGACGLTASFPFLPASACSTSALYSFADRITPSTGGFGSSGFFV
jgi:hypothetical protein